MCPGSSTISPYFTMTPFGLSVRSRTSQRAKSPRDNSRAVRIATPGPLHSGRSSPGVQNPRTKWRRTQGEVGKHKNPKIEVFSTG